MSASGVDKSKLEQPGRDILLVSDYDEVNGRMVLSRAAGRRAPPRLGRRDRALDDLPGPPGRRRDPPPARLGRGDQGHRDQLPVRHRGARRERRRADRPGARSRPRDRRPAQPRHHRDRREPRRDARPDHAAPACARSRWPEQLGCPRSGRCCAAPARPTGPTRGRSWGSPSSCSASPPRSTRSPSAPSTTAYSLLVALLTGPLSVSMAGIVLYAGMLDRVVGHHLYGHRAARPCAARCGRSRGSACSRPTRSSSPRPRSGPPCFVVPGLIVFTLFCLVGPLVNIEGIGVRAAFRRSASLVRTAPWPTVFLVTVPTYVEITLLHGVQFAEAGHPYLLAFGGERGDRRDRRRLRRPVRGDARLRAAARRAPALSRRVHALHRREPVVRAATCTSARSARRAAPRRGRAASTESPTVTYVTTRIVPVCGRFASSTTITPNTIEARPRGPNQPRNATVGRCAFDPHIASATGSHAHHGEAEHRVERHLPGEVAERGPQEDRAEEEERDRVEQPAGLVEEVRVLGAAAAAEAAEDHPADERGDEAGAAQRSGDPVREQGRGDGDELQPGPLDQPAAARPARRSPPRACPRRGRRAARTRSPRPRRWSHARPSSRRPGSRRRRARSGAGARRSRR